MSGYEESNTGWRQGDKKQTYNQRKHGEEIE